MTRALKWYTGKYLFNTKEDSHGGMKEWKRQDTEDRQQEWQTCCCQSGEHMLWPLCVCQDQAPRLARAWGQADGN